MRICLISREYPTDDHGGGIGTYTEKAARGLARLGHSVEVVTETADAPSISTEEGVRVHRLARPRLPRMQTLARTRLVARRLRQLPQAPDIVQACEFGAEAAWYSLSVPDHTKLVTRLATPSFVVRELNQHGPARRTAGAALLDCLERLQARRSDAVISISQAITDVVCDAWDVPRSKVTLMKTGVDFAARYSGGSLPTEIAGREYILYFGRLEERKGVHILARALPEVMARHPGLHAVFAGQPLPYDGRPMDDFVRSCNRDHLDRLHFLPRQRQTDLYPLLANATLVTLPSLWEGLGNVALEAVDMGKPVIATSGSGFNEILEHGRSGILVAPGDVGALREAIQTLLADHALAERLACGARERARSFELTRVTEALAGFYAALLSEPTADRRRPKK